MSKYQGLKNVIEAFESKEVDVPIIYSTTELNVKDIEALTGRNIKLHRSIIITIAVYIVFALAATMLALAIGRVAPVVVSTIFIPLFASLYFYRSTIIMVTHDGLDFYFSGLTFASKYTVSDKFGLTYDCITNVKVRTGKLNTKFTIEFSKDDKKYTMNTTIPNKTRKMEEQSQNIKQMLEVLNEKHLISK